MLTFLKIYLSIVLSGACNGLMSGYREFNVICQQYDSFLDIQGTIGDGSKPGSSGFK